GGLRDLSNDLLTAARRFATENAVSEEATKALIQRGRALQVRLEEAMERLRALRRTLTEWNAVLTRIATRDVDPLRRFIAFHEAKDYQRALDTFAALDPTSIGASERSRRLDCLGSLGEVDEYRRAMEDGGAEVGTD